MRPAKHPRFVSRSKGIACRICDLLMRPQEFPSTDPFEFPFGIAHPPLRQAVLQQKGEVSDIMKYLEMGDRHHHANVLHGT